MRLVGRQLESLAHIVQDVRQGQFDAAGVGAGLTFTLLAELAKLVGETHLEYLHMFQELAFQTRPAKPTRKRVTHARGYARVTRLCRMRRALPMPSSSVGSGLRSCFQHLRGPHFVTFVSVTLPIIHACQEVC
jgi:hypothetical protein